MIKPEMEGSYGEEMNSLKDNQVFKRKIDADGSVGRYTTKLNRQTFINHSIVT